MSSNHLFPTIPGKFIRTWKCSYLNTQKVTYVPSLLFLSKEKTYFFFLKNSKLYQEYLTKYL